MNILIVGATSAMAHESAKCFAAAGAPRFLLVGRDAQKLAVVAADLRARGATHVDLLECDLANTGACEELAAKATAALGKIDVALVAHGVLGVQAEAQASYAASEALLRVNFLSYVAILTALANVFEAQRSGVIAAISSVAGDRGRQSNYVYGAAKAGLSAFLGGLRNRLAKSGVHVVTIKPGFVASPMTAHLQQGALFVPASRAGQDIHRAVVKRRNTAYVPFFWCYIMLIIKAIPEFVFKRLKL
jgi:short-subunit dehydrogenase